MKKFIVILLLICSLFSFTGCAQEPEIQYIDKYIEVPTSHGTHEGFIWDPYKDENTVTIFCKQCGKELGKINKITKEVIVEKEVEKIVYQEVPVEIIKEVVVEKEVVKTIEVEKFVSIKDLKMFTWEEVKSLKVGDRVTNALIRNNSFITKITKENVNPAHTTQWTTGVYSFSIETMESVCKLKINHTDLPHPKYDGIQEDYTTFGNIGIWSGTISEIVWNTDEYGNKTVNIFFFKKDCEMKTLLDFVLL